MKKFGYSKQFLFFLLQNLFMGICGMIDTGFGNRINLDSVCVLSAYTVITWTTYALYSLGMYAYRVILSDTKLCFLIQIAAGFIVGIILLSTSPLIVRLYNLPGTQSELLSDCLRIHAFSCPALSIMKFLRNYAEYKCKNKQAFIGNVIFYSIMIFTDFLVLYFKKGLTNLLWCTLLCSVIYVIYEIFALDFWSEPFYFSWDKLKEILKHGCNTLIDRSTGKVATIFFNVYASRLGTFQYSIHAVCYSICIFGENFTNALSSYGVVSMSCLPDKENVYEHCKQMIRKHFPLCVFGQYIFAYVLLSLTHGSVPIKDCLLWTAVYSSDIITLVFYESFKAYLMSHHETGYLKWGGTIGIFIRIPITFIGYHLGFGLWPFALASTFDFSARAVYFYLCSKKVHHKSRLNI